ncbi:alpha/beta hydrolase [Lampropedia puyangensis]|nr:alpha/beta hydrolase-fold protein [Lampropedia puyangensis]
MSSITLGFAMLTPPLGASAEAPATPAKPTTGTHANTSELTSAAPAALPFAREHLLHSTATGRHYRIQVSTIGKPPANGYPVVYVLDGDAMFPVVAAAAQGMWMSAEENRVRPMLIVGVGYAGAHMLDEQARAEDYTPPAPDLSETGDTRAQRQGGGQRFLQFLTEELQPAIAKAYPVDRNEQTLLGHSYGGLFTLYALFSRPEAFRHYIASSPSIWWNKGYINQLREDFSKRYADSSADLQQRLRLTIGEYEQTPAPTIADDSQRAVMMRERAQVDQARAFAQSLQTELPGLSVVLEEYPAQTHATAALYAIVDGLRFASD